MYGGVARGGVYNVHLRGKGEHGGLFGGRLELERAEGAPPLLGEPEGGLRRCASSFIGLHEVVRYFFRNFYREIGLFLGVVFQEIAHHRLVYIFEVKRTSHFEFKIRQLS